MFEPVVLGTEVLFRACIAPGEAFEVLRRVLDRGGLVFSDETYRELAQLLLSPELDSYLSLRRRTEALADLESLADWTEPGPAPHLFPRRYQDRLYATAVSGNTAWLVTEEKPLLALAEAADEPMEKPRILTPAAFLKAVGDEP